MPTTINVATGDATNYETPALVVNLFQGVTQPGGGTGAVDRALGGAISQLIADGEIKGKLGELTLIHTMERIPARRVVVAGLGKSQDFDTGAVRWVSGDAARFLRRKGISEYATIAHGAGIGGLNAVESAQAIAEGTPCWDCTSSTITAAMATAPMVVTAPMAVTTLTAQDGGIQAVTIVERDARTVDVMTAGVSMGTVLAESTMIARDLVNHPANVMTPTKMAEAAREVAEIRRPRTGRDGPGPDAGARHGRFPGCGPGQRGAAPADRYDLPGRPGQPAE